MIELKDKKECCGCHACVSICAHKAISMQADTEGFLYPLTDKAVCTECGLCEKVCPVIHQGSPRHPLNVYASKSKDETIRQESSSGGIFTLLAEAIIREGGIVFGAKFDETWNVIHASAENLDKLADFRGSKYVQSIIGNTYKEAKEQLKQGRKVLFSGTPCQIAGLKQYLGKEYKNLLTVDFICHGVPSPLVWERYLCELQENLGIDYKFRKDKTLSSLYKLPAISSISFRKKTYGWKKFSFYLRFVVPQELSTSTLEEAKEFVEPFPKNTYMKGFLADLYLRPSCHYCPSRCFRSGSDITLGDFWGIKEQHPEMDDDKGISAIIVNSEKGFLYTTKINAELLPTKLQAVKVKNPALYVSCKPHRNRTKFFPLKKNHSLEKHIQKFLRPTLWEYINQSWYKIKTTIKFRHNNRRV